MREDRQKYRVIHIEPDHIVVRVQRVEDCRTDVSVRDTVALDEFSARFRQVFPVSRRSCPQAMGDEVNLLGNLVILGVDNERAFLERGIQVLL